MSALRSIPPERILRILHTVYRLELSLDGINNNNVKNHLQSGKPDPVRKYNVLVVVHRYKR